VSDGEGGAGTDMLGWGSHTVRSSMVRSCGDGGGTGASGRTEMEGMVAHIGAKVETSRHVCTSSMGYLGLRNGGAQA
jgi:hypothetical protein